MSVEKIDFYLLNNASRDQLLIFTCRLTEKAYQQGLHIHIQTGGPDDTAELDQLLWTFSQQSFLPHQQSADENELCAVTLHHDWPPHNRGLLINLSAQVPEYYGEFNRVAEVVGSNPEQIQAGRDHYRFYASNGLKPTHHKVG